MMLYTSFRVFVFFFFFTRCTPDSHLSWAYASGSLMASDASRRPFKWPTSLLRVKLKTSAGHPLAFANLRYLVEGRKTIYFIF